jgi:hypothetical protein
VDVFRYRRSGVCLHEEGDTMKVKAEELRKGFERLGRLVGRNIPNSMLMRAHDDGLTLVGVGDGMWAQVEVPVVESDTFEVTVGAPNGMDKFFGGFQGEVAMKVNKVAVNLSSKEKVKLNAKLNVRDTPVEVFGKPEQSEGEWMPVPPGLKKILYADDDPASGFDVVWFFEGGAAATNMGATRLASISFPNTVVVTARAESLNRVLKETDQIMLTDNKVWTRGDGVLAAFSSDYRTLPFLRKLVTHEGWSYDTWFLVNRQLLISTLNSLFVLSTSEAFREGLVDIVLENGELALSAHGNQIGKAEAKMETVEHSGDFSAELSITQLVNALQNSVDENVRLANNANGNDVLISDTTNIEHRTMRYNVEVAARREEKHGEKAD